MALNNPYALYFDGVDDYARINTAGSFVNNPALTGQLTIEFWGNIFSSVSANGTVISSGSADGYRGFHIYNFSSGPFMILVEGTKRWRIDNLYMPLGTWHHYAFAWDNNVLKYYVDGTLRSEVGYTSYNNNSISSVLHIGRRGTSTPYYSRQYIDELRIWDHYRTQDQIQENIHKSLVGNELGLYIYLRFDEGIGNIAYDSSPNGKHATIVGATWVEGQIDLHTDDRVIELSATAHGRATGTAKPLRGRSASAAAHGRASASANPIRGRGLRATAHGAATAQARPYKIAIARAIAQGAATAKAVILVLTIPKGVYNIDADNFFNRNQPITPDSLANYIEVWVNPLKPVAEAEEVYKTDEDDPFPIAANETKTVTIHYKKEPVTEVNIEFVNAPPYATIDNIKHYAWGADVTVTSPDAGTFELVATGKPLEVQGRELVVKKNETSILENGVKKYTFDNPFVQDRATAEMIAEKLLAFAVPQADIEIDWRGDPALVLADPVLIPTFQRQGLDQREVFYVTKQELEYDGGLRAKLAGRKMGGEGNDLAKS